MGSSAEYTAKRRARMLREHRCVQCGRKRGPTSTKTYCYRCAKYHRDRKHYQTLLARDRREQEKRSQRLPGPYPNLVTQDEAHANLARWVLLQAFEDSVQVQHMNASTDDPVQIQTEARAFLTEGDALFWCVVAGVDPAAVRRAVR